MSIDDVIDEPLLTLTPTKDEAATVWWQASKRFFDGVDDIDPPTFQVQDGDRPRHQDPSSPPQVNCPRDFSPFRDQGGENFPRSPSPTRPSKMPRIHSSPLSTRSNRVTSAYNVAHHLQEELDSLRAIVSPLQKDVVELQSLREEVSLLRSKVSALEPLQDQVLSLKEKVSALEPLQDQVLSLKEEVSALRTLQGQINDDAYFSEPDQPSAFVVRSVRRGLRPRRDGRSISTPFTAIKYGRRRNKKQSAILDVSPIPQPPPNAKAHVSPIQEPPPNAKADVSPVLEHPLNAKAAHVSPVPQSDAKSTSLVKHLPHEYRNIKHLQGIDWTTYQLPPSTINMSDRFNLAETIEDVSLWAKTPVDFYLHERGQGCYVEFSKLGDVYVRLDRQWWGMLLGVEELGYFETSHLDVWISRLLLKRKVQVTGAQKLVPEKQAEILGQSRWTIMPASFMECELFVGTPESYMKANGTDPFSPAWWTVDKVFIPMCAQRHWFLIELQLPSFKVVVYDSSMGHLPTKVLEVLVCRKLRDHLPTYLDKIRYWEMSGNIKPKKMQFKFEREKNVPQQASLDVVCRGDCGAFVCMFMDQLCIKQQKLALPATSPTSASAGLAYRHLMAACIYIMRLLPPNFNDP